MSCSFPLIDYYHVSLFLALFFLVIFTDLKININLEKYAIIFILAIGIIWMFMESKWLNGMKILHFAKKTGSGRWYLV